jgi:hypothetical protein
MVADCKGKADAAMTACAPTNQTTQWCCGDNNQACCRVWPNHPDAASIPLVFTPIQAQGQPGGGGGGGGAVPSAMTFITLSGATTTAVQLSAPSATEQATNPTDGAGVGGGDPGSPGQGQGVPAADQPPATDAPAATADGASLQPGTGAGPLSTQAIAGIAAGVVVVVVVLVTIGCFMAENWYKKRNRIFAIERRGSMKNRIRMGFDRDSPERAQQLM